MDKLFCFFFFLAVASRPFGSYGNILPVKDYLYENDEKSGYGYIQAYALPHQQKIPQLPLVMNQLCQKVVTNSLFYTNLFIFSFPLYQCFFWSATVSTNTFSQYEVKLTFWALS